MVGLHHSMDLGREQRQWISPVLIEANQVLLLSRTELQAAMRAEVARNPALELDFDAADSGETRQCPICGDALHGGYCHQCRTKPQETASRETYEDYPEQWYAGWGREAATTATSTTPSPWFQTRKTCAASG